jgi:hypothetical protein
MLLTTARNASITVPKTRKGIDNNQIIGHRSKANTAIGQQITNKIAQRIKTSNVFIFSVSSNKLCNTFVTIP